MSSTVKRTFALPERTASLVDKLVASGAYANEGEVVQAGLEALQERAAEIEKWLRAEAVPVYDAVQAGTCPVFSGDEVEAALLAYHQERVKKPSV